MATRKTKKETSEIKENIEVKEKTEVKNDNSKIVKVGKITIKYH